MPSNSYIWTKLFVFLLFSITIDFIAQLKAPLQCSKGGRVNFLIWDIRHSSERGNSIITMTRMWGEYHKVIPTAYLTPRFACKLLDFSKLLPRQFVWIQNFKWSKTQLWEGHLEAIKWHPGMLSVLVEGWKGEGVEGDELNNWVWRWLELKLLIWECFNNCASICKSIYCTYTRKALTLYQWTSK